MKDFFVKLSIKQESPTQKTGVCMSHRAQTQNEQKFWILIESMMGFKQRKASLNLGFRLFSLMRGLQIIKL